MNQLKVGILGAGRWGAALASVVCDNAHSVVLCTQNHDSIQRINNLHKVPASLGEHTLPSNITATENFQDLQSLDIILIALPSAAFKENMQQLEAHINQYLSASIFVICSKGFIKDSEQFLSDYIYTKHPKQKVAILSGPNFANEVIQKKHSAAVIASKNEDALNKLKKLFTSKHFYVQPSHDVIGTQICGAIKNVFAIGAGILKGLALGENCHALFLTKSLQEISKIVQKLAKNTTETVNSVAGIGDLVLTCSCLTSRNTNFGYQIAKKNQIYKLLSNMTVEGYYSAKAFHSICEHNNIEAPIVNAVYAILYQGQKPDILLNFLKL